MIPLLKLQERQLETSVKKPERMAENHCTTEGYINFSRPQIFNATDIERKINTKNGRQPSGGRHMTV